MVKVRPFAFNTGDTIPDMVQSGDLSIGPFTGSTHRYDLHYGDVTWYMGCDETLGYVVGLPHTSKNRPKFKRSPFTEQGYLQMVNRLSTAVGGAGPFTDTLAAKNWVNSEGFWQTYTGGTGPSPTPTPSASMVPSPTPTPTPSVTPGPNLDSFSLEVSGTSVYNLMAGNALQPEDNSEWDFGDGNTSTTVNVNVDHTYIAPYLEPVSKTITFTTDDLTLMSTLQCAGYNTTTQINKVYAVDFSNIKKTNAFSIFNTEINTLDFSTFTGMTGSINIYNNPQLRELNAPTQDISSGYISNLTVYNNDALTEMDFTGLNRLASTIVIHGNALLETLLLPTVPNTVGNIYTLEIRSNPLITDLDVSGLDRIGRDIKIYSNSALTGITFPATLNSAYTDVRRLDLYSNDLTGNLDVSMFDKLGGYVQIYYNSNLTGIDFADTLQAVSDPISSIVIRGNTNFVGDLDLSMFTKIGGSLRIDNQPSLTGITFPSSAAVGNNFSYVSIYSNGITELDMSKLTKLGGNFQVSNMTSLTELTLPATLDGGSNNFTNVNLGYLGVTELDLSSLTKLGTALNISQNDSLTGVTFASTVAGTNITTTYLNDNPVLKYIDLSSLTKLSGTIIMFTHAYETIDFPSSMDAGAADITYLALHNGQPGLVGHQDLSGLTKLSGNISMYGNSLLTGVTFPATMDASVGNLTRMTFASCDLASLDLSMFTRARGVNQTSSTYVFNFTSNTGLTECSFPTVETGATYVYMSNRIYFSNCSLNEASVDELFEKLLEYYDVVTPVGDVTIHLDNDTSGDNSLPSAAGYADISSLETIFTNASRTLTIDLNE